MKPLRASVLLLSLAAITIFGVTWVQPISTAFDQVPNPDMIVSLEGDLLSVKLTNVPVRAVLDEIARQGRIAVSVRGELTDTISTEFRRLPLEEGLTQLLRNCGWIAVGRQGGRIERLVVAQKSVTNGAGPETRSVGSAETIATPADPPRVASDAAGAEPASVVAAMVGRPAVKTFFDVAAHRPDPPAKLEAFAGFVDAVTGAEVGQLLVMLQDADMPAATWERALTPLADVLTPQEQTTFVRSLGDRAVRDELISSFQQVYLFKSSQERERQP